MKSFLEYIRETKEVIKEMPYLFDDEVGHIDLEWEKFAKSKHKLILLVKQLNNIFSGKKYEDKYNNIIELKTAEEKDKFRNNMLRDKTLILQAKEIFGLTPDGFRILIDNIIKGKNITEIRHSNEREIQSAADFLQVVLNDYSTKYKGNDGWLVSPLKNFYHCGFTGHEWALGNIDEFKEIREKHKNADLVLLAFGYGWLRIGVDMFHDMIEFESYGKALLSQAQLIDHIKEELGKDILVKTRNSQPSYFKG